MLPSWTTGRSPYRESSHTSSAEASDSQRVRRVRHNPDVATFASKSLPDEDKLRGGYYTPEPIARFLADWVAVAGKTLLEPSCGDGSILGALVTANPLGSTTGVELNEREAATARRVGATEVVHADFFQWFTQERANSFDGVAGNPPFIRFGHWDERYREPAMEFMSLAGIRTNRLTNAWVPFVAASLAACKPAGRVALVVPAELLQVSYAAPLRDFLVDNCSDLTIVSFRDLVFPGVLQEVVLLLAVKGEGPCAIRTLEYANAADLPDPSTLEQPEIRAALHDTEKWTKYYLGADDIALLRRAKTDPEFLVLRNYAEVDVGVVTGRNAFFCMTDTEARDRHLLPWTTPLVSRSAQLQGLVIDVDAFEQLTTSEGKTRLLTIASSLDQLPEPLKAYVDLGETAGVHEGYKCRIRKRWYVVPSIWVPDAFLLRQISQAPRLVVNSCDAVSTDTVHRVRCRAGVDKGKLATAFYNSLTFAMTEILGRSYGGGILELEPSEAEGLPMPNWKHVSRALQVKVAKRLDLGDVGGALDLVDHELLVKRHGLSEGDVAQLRRSWEQLRNRRTARGKSSR